jgi:hypothetical protein
MNYRKADANRLPLGVNGLNRSRARGGFDLRPEGE